MPAMQHCSITMPCRATLRSQSPADIHNVDHDVHHVQCNANDAVSTPDADVAVDCDADVDVASLLGASRSSLSK